jgi:hypothetical protein
VGVFFAPVSPTGAHPSTTAVTAGVSGPAGLRIFRGVSLPHRSWMNKWTHLLTLAMEWRSCRAQVNEWRKRRLQLPDIPNGFGVLPLIKKQTLPIIHPLHPAFFAKPTDWPAELKVPAFIFLPDKPAPAPFLSSDLRLELAANRDDASSSSSTHVKEEEEEGSWEKKEDESAKEEEQRLERFFRSSSSSSSSHEEGRAGPVFFACGGLVSSPASARSLLDLAAQLAAKTQRQVVLFIRDEDGPAKQPQPLASSAQTTDGDGGEQAVYSSEGDGVADVHGAWTDVIYGRSGAIPEALCVVSRLSYASILPKCGCAVLDGGHAITGVIPSVQMSGPSFHLG